MMPNVATLLAPPTIARVSERPAICRLTADEFARLAEAAELQGRSACALCYEWSCALNTFFVARHCGMNDDHG